MSEDILEGRAYSGQYSILKGSNFQGGANAPPPPNETLLGLNVKANIHVAKNATYTRLSVKAIQEMLFIMSEVIETHILTEMKASDHFALMFNETTDCTVTEQLAIHGRYIHKGTGELKSHYLKVIDTLKPEIDALNSGVAGDLDTCISIGASTITKRVTEFTAQARLDMVKMRGIGTDGAATMTGCRTAVVVRHQPLAYIVPPIDLTWLLHVQQMAFRMLRNFRTFCGNYMITLIKVHSRITSTTKSCSGERTAASPLFDKVV